MKISISNLGVVPDLQINLKPLTIFVGENGTGKTWTAYTIAAIFSQYGLREYLRTYLQDERAFRYSAIEEAISDLIEKGSATLNIVKFSEEWTETFINEIAKLASRWMDSFMETRQVDFRKLKVRIELSDEARQSFSSELKNSSVEIKALVGVKKDTSELELKGLKEEGSDELYLYTTYTKSRSEEIPPPVIDKEVRSFVVRTILGIMSTLLFQNVVIFPTERTTFITLSFPHDREEYRKIAKLEIELEPDRFSIAWRVPEPVKALLGIIDSCMRQHSEHSVRRAEREQDPTLINIIKLGKFLENEILLGNISAEKRGKEVELMYNPSEKVSLELNVSSSMVKELTPLALYLRCLARAGDLIIIDEPEMNLHPAAQVEFTEFLGMLVNAGLNILITTHSPYIVDHIPNLIRAHELDKEKVKEYFYLKQTTSFLSKDDVSVYLFDGDSVTDILKEDGDIDWGTFSNVTRDISTIYSNLIE